MPDLQEMLLAQLAAGGTGTPASVADLLAGAVGEDPSMAPVLAALRAREADREPARQPTDPAEDDADPPDQVADVLERLHQEVLALRTRTRELACALGACPRCFGEQPGCPRCGGRGRPGARDPEPVLFHEYLAPAVRRHQARLTRLAREPRPAPAGADPHLPAVADGRARRGGPPGPALTPHTEGDQWSA